MSDQKENSSKSELEEKVISIIQEALGKKDQKVTLSTRFKEDLKADSLEVFEIIYEIENKMGITISEDKANNVETVEDLVKIIESHPGK
jgi:acyl carrier protein